MLRRRLILRVGTLICAFVAGAVVALSLLQDVLGRTAELNRDAALLIDGVQSIATSVTSIEAAGYQPRAAADDHAAAIATLAGQLDAAMERIATHPVTRAPDGAAADVFERTRQLLPGLVSRATGMARGEATAGSFADTLAAHAAVEELGVCLRAHIAGQQIALQRYFRAMVFVLTIAALIMVNVAVLVLLRTSQMILKPVAALVDGSRELAAENFAHRVRVDQDDEFGELAHAYNRLAEQLQSNEARKTETLHQLAITLNHGLNNAMTIIELQLGLLDRQTGGNPALAAHLREIRGSLGRMSQIVASLKHIRRVVLTDYAPGLKMIDLERSVEAGDGGTAEQALPTEPTR